MGYFTVETFRSSFEAVWGLDFVINYPYTTKKVWPNYLSEYPFISKSLSNGLFVKG